MKTWKILAGILVLAALQGAHAQESPQQDTLQVDEEPEDRETRPFCLRGRMLPVCGSFLLTEATVLVPISGSNMSGDDFPLAFGYEFGGMVNVSRRSAVGVSYFFFIDGHDDRSGIKGRYRRWLSPSFAADLGLGAVLKNETQERDHWYLTSLGLSYTDRLHFVVQYEIGRTHSNHFTYAHGVWTPSTTQRRIAKLYTGVKIGGEPGIVMAAAGVVIAAVVFVSTFDLPSSYGNQ